MALDLWEQRNWVSVIRKQDQKYDNQNSDILIFLPPVAILNESDPSNLDFFFTTDVGVSLIVFIDFSINLDVDHQQLPTTRIVVGKMESGRDVYTHKLISSKSSIF